MPAAFATLLGIPSSGGRNGLPANPAGFVTATRASVARDVRNTVSSWNVFGAVLEAAATATHVSWFRRWHWSPPMVSLADAGVSEGTATLGFTATLSRASGAPVTVGYSTANGTAVAGSDYVGGSGTVTFAAGQTSQTVNVGVIGDTTVESDETFTVTLSNPSGATVSRAVATGTILNDDVVPPPMVSPTFVGDYSTGDFSQWPTIQVKGYNGPPSGYVPTYSASIVNDPVKGSVGRFEVRSGDVPPFGGGERAEVQSGNQTGGTEGKTMWYRFSTRFDPSFPQNHANLAWGVTNQWHSIDAGGSPPVGWYVDKRNGFWSLTINKQSSPGVYVQAFSIFDIPLGTDWHDVKMQVRWSSSDSVGFIRLWLNGVPQTFINGSDIYYARTLVPGTSGVYYKEGMYRGPMTATDIVYHTGFRSATDESGL